LTSRFSTNEKINKEIPVWLLNVFHMENWICSKSTKDW